MTDASIRKIAALFPDRWDHHYVASKLRTDPLYAALAEELRGSEQPLLDLGCGLGLLAFYLREEGIDIPIQGLDYDERKVASANRGATIIGAAQLAFSHHDARTGLPDHHGNVTILDILQFFNSVEQASLLALAAERVVPGGKLIVRSGLRDRSWRFQITILGDLLAKATLWMKAGPTHFPTAEDFHDILSPYGSVRIAPLWGRTPFNNHLIVLTKKSG
jgi:2-polyprenyl-3-methyl-5-hydroxy-6-metoxy-1,4-benzoquinol methylase